MKRILKSGTPIFKIADPNEDFAICTDACKEGIGGVLMQHGHVVFYESRKFKEHVKNYSTGDLQLDVIVHALKMSRHYLMRKKRIKNGSQWYKI